MKEKLNMLYNKKIALLLAVFLIFTQRTLAVEYLVKVKPTNKITTSDANLKAGDVVEFATMEEVSTLHFQFKKGQKVTGVITSLEPNDFGAQPAKIFIESFKTKDSNNNNTFKLKGVVYKKGKDYHSFTDNIMFYPLKGGEVKITPEKDTFRLYVEDNL